VPALFAQLLDELLYQEGRTPEQEQRDLLLAAELAEDAGWYRLERGGAAFKRLRRDLAAALVPVVEGTTLPAKERVQAGVYLGWLGDPRPGVCTLPPAMVQIEGGEFVIGSTPEEAEQIIRSYEQYYMQRRDKELAEWYSEFVKREINTHSVIIGSFEIGKYLITNAQYKIFIDDNGYDSSSPWWDEAGRAWLLSEDPKEWNKSFRRLEKKLPVFWHHERFGIVCPNHPVAGVSLYEAIAFCRWLTQHQMYNSQGYIYMLPSEAEWEYAARGQIRRTYPWGDNLFDNEKANHNYGIDGTTSAVGCFPSGTNPEGVHDLIGNLWEWTRSAFYPYPYDPNDGREAWNNFQKHDFVRRGESYMDENVVAPLSFRNPWPPDNPNGGPSFRLVRYPPNKT
jgi:formylglycine-generating enzyme required for sulfatase activity